MQQHPPRIYILLSDSLERNLIIRRGPSKWSCTLLWNRLNDQFTIGQWVKARIYEERCDLTPDGKHFLYFALNGHWDSESNGTYSAISRTPYLKAIDFFPEGDTWGGGGIFIDNEKFIVHVCPYGQTRENIENKLNIDFDGYYAQGSVHHRNELHPINQREYLNPRKHRLMQQCWKDISADKSEIYGPYLYKKSLPNGWELLMRPAQPEEGYSQNYAHDLFNYWSKTILQRPQWEWADLDRKRLVFVERGILYKADLTQDGHGTSIQLYDFNPMKFEPLEAPY